MDPMAQVLSIGCIAAATAFVIKVVADGVIRLVEARRAERRSVGATGLSERVARMENAIDTLAIELERIGEISRFSLQLAQRQPTLARVPTPIPIASMHRTDGQSITPH